MDLYKEWLGIPEGSRPPNHYELLRLIQFEDDTDKIRAHYKKLNTHVRKYATGPYSVQSQDLLNELAKAMLCLTDSGRKRDYDESLGREFPAEVDEFGRQPILDVLVRQGVITRDQLKEIEEFASRRGLTHRDAAVQMKLVDPEKAAQALAIQLGYPYVDLEDMLPEDDALDLVSRAMVKRHSFIPLFIDDGQLLIACVDQPEHELEDELRIRANCPIRVVIATPRSINQAIAQHYAPGMRDEAKLSGSTGAAASPQATKKSKAKQGPRKSFEELNPEEKKLRKQYGWLMMLWGFGVPMLPSLMKVMAPLSFVWWPDLISWIGAVVIGPAVVYWVTQKYWK